MNKINSLENLIINLSRFPSVGRKSAERLAYYILKSDPEYAFNLAESIKTAKEKIKFCRICCNITEDEICSVCGDDSRDKNIICVVEDFVDVIAIEKSESFKGLYHVLGGTLAPLKGITPDKLRIAELLARLTEHPAAEVIIATNPTVDGDATALYLNREIGKLGIKTSRLGLGMPIGGSLEYVDEITLRKALEGRGNI